MVTTSAARNLTLEDLIDLAEQAKKTWIELTSTHGSSLVESRSAYKDYRRLVNSVRRRNEKLQDRIAAMGEDNNHQLQPY